MNITGCFKLFSRKEKSNSAGRSRGGLGRESQDV